MARHVIVGAGPIGSTLAGTLADAGHDVLVLSRSGASAAPTTPTASAAPTTPTASAAPPSSRPGQITHRALDATDAAALATATAGAAALYNCANPPYHRWPTDWPPIADALLQTAEQTGAVLVTVSNLYGYGAGTQHMLESSPLASRETKGVVRASMWREAERRHRDGRLRATEVRGSDYVGRGAPAQSHAGPRMLVPLLAGRTIRPIGAADVPHTWTYLDDFARALAAAATTEAAWGHAWHVPSPEPLTFRELATRIATAAGAPAPRIRPLPLALVRALGLVQPMLREVHAVGYQFVEPFVMDSIASQHVLGCTPTPWESIIDAVVADLSTRAGAGAPVAARRP